MENQNVLETFHKILNIVNNCENLSSTFVKDGKIENACDYLMDAQIIKMSHDLMGSTADKIGNSDFSEEEFVAALTNMITDVKGEMNFEILANAAVKCCKTSEFSVSLLGTFEFDAAARPAKVQKERQRIKKSLEPTKAPINVTQLEKSSKGAEKINIVRSEIQRICRDRDTEDIPYFEVVCHPTNFMKSVDNAFQISFLIRDGFLGLKKVNKEPHVYLVDRSQSQHTQHASDTIQCVMTINTKVWRENIDKFDIDEPLLNLSYDEEEERGSFVSEIEEESD